MNTPDNNNEQVVESETGTNVVQSSEASEDPGNLQAEIQRRIDDGTPFTLLEGDLNEIDLIDSVRGQFVQPSTSGRNVKDGFGDSLNLNAHAELIEGDHYTVKGMDKLDVNMFEGSLVMVEGLYDVPSGTEISIISMGHNYTVCFTVTNLPDGSNTGLKKLKCYFMDQREFHSIFSRNTQ